VKSYQASLAIAERLAKSDPGNARWQSDLSASYNMVGDVQRAQGDLAAALKSYQASLTISERLAAANPRNADRQTDLVVSLYKVSTVSPPAEARILLTRALAILNTLSRTGKLTAAQQKWPDMLRAALAKLPPA
jgi:tetratricopeptide (TPR) repeat protein